MIQAVVFIAVDKALMDHCNGERVWGATSPLSAFPSFPCTATTSSLGQKIYLLLRWLPNWWGLGLRRLLLAPARASEWAIFAFSVGVPLIYIVAFAASRLTHRLMRLSDEKLHMIYWVTLLGAGDTVSFVSEVVGQAPSDFFTIPASYTSSSILSVSTTRPLFYCLLKVGANPVNCLLLSRVPK